MLNTLLFGLYRAKYRLRNILGGSKLGFYLMQLWPWWKNDKIASGHTKICIEGFPRSSNTFLYKTIQMWNPNMKIAHHIHVPMQAIYCARRGIPSVVLIRAPSDAIAGAMNRRKWLDSKLALSAYIRFYRKIVKNPSGILVFKFETVIENPSRVIDCINKFYNFNCKFEVWSDEYKKQVFKKTRNNPEETSKDVGAKDVMKKEVENQGQYQDAMDIYNQTLSLAENV